MRGLFLIFFLLVLFVFLPGRGEAKVYFQYNVGYSSESDGDEGSAVSQMRHIGFLGATFGKGDNIIFGQSVISSSLSNKASSTATAAELSLLELGPRLTWYMNDGKNFSLSGAWHPYVEGTRTNSSGVAEEVSGSSYVLMFAYELKITKKFYMGAAISYYSMTIDESTISGTVTTVSDAYSSIYPSLEMSYRFK